MTLKEHFKERLMNALFENESNYEFGSNPFAGSATIYKPTHEIKNKPGSDTEIQQMTPEKAKSLIGIAPGFTKTPSQNTLAARKKNIARKA